MPSSRFIDLANGDEVRLDFSPPSGLDFQLLGADGRPLGPEVSVVAPELAIDVAAQIDASNIAALTGGGFIVAYEERRGVVGAGFASETLKTVTFDAHGQQQAALALPAGTVAPGGAVAGIGVFALSGDAFAVVFDRTDGGVVSHHLALNTYGSGLADLALPGPIFHVDNGGGALTLGFADGRQVIVGGAGADALSAGAGGDLLRGGGGDDTLKGGAGTDDINGNAGNDSLQGGAGADVLRGGQGDDVISGGEGDDFLSGDRGADTLSGGAGADLFHASAQSGLDVITDFNAAEGDRIQLEPGTPYSVVQSGADVVIRLGVNHDVFDGELLLKNVQLSSLPEGFILLG